CLSKTTNWSAKISCQPARHGQLNVRCPVQARAAERRCSRSASRQNMSSRRRLETTTDRSAVPRDGGQSGQGCGGRHAFRPWSFLQSDKSEITVRDGRKWMIVFEKEGREKGR